MIAAAIVFALTASSLVFARTVRQVAPGKWSGKHVNLTVTEAGFEFEFDCTAGSAKGPTVIDRHGKFKLYGTYVSQPGSPSVPRESHPAEYSGLVKGTLMTLEVRLTDTKQLVGIYKLVFGQHQRLNKCPVSQPRDINPEPTTARNYHQIRSLASLTVRISAGTPARLQSP